jgi:hypothetical protein
MGDLLYVLDGCDASDCGLRDLKCVVFNLIVLLSVLCEERFKDLRVSLRETVRPVGMVDLMKSIGMPCLSNI